MNGGKLAVMPTEHLSLHHPRQFRMALVSLLGGAIGLVAGAIAYALYNLIAVLHEYLLLSPGPRSTSPAPAETILVCGRS